jgi:hypothetical protein
LPAAQLAAAGRRRLRDESDERTLKRCVFAFGAAAVVSASSRKTAKCVVVPLWTRTAQIIRFQIDWFVGYLLLFRAWAVSWLITILSIGLKRLLIGSGEDPMGSTVIFCWVQSAEYL